MTAHWSVWSISRQRYKRSVAHRFPKQRTNFESALFKPFLETPIVPLPGGHRGAWACSDLLVESCCKLVGQQAHLLWAILQHQDDLRYQCHFSRNIVKRLRPHWLSRLVPCAGTSFRSWKMLQTPRGVLMCCTPSRRHGTSRRTGWNPVE